MARIVGLGDRSEQQVYEELQQGARFVVFTWALSIVILSFKNETNIHYIAPGEGTFAKALWPTLLSLTVGWWGIPWGPIYTIWAVAQNLSGGRDVTDQVMLAAYGHLAERAAAEAVAT